MSNVSEPREFWIYQKHNRIWVEYSKLHIADVWSVETHVIEHSAFESMRKRAEAEHQVASGYHKEIVALRKERDGWQNLHAELADAKLQHCIGIRQERDAALAENEKLKRDNLLALDIADRFANERAELRAKLAEWKERYCNKNPLSLENDELRSRLDAQRLINEAQAKAGEEAFLDARKTALAHSKELTFRAEQLTAERARTQVLERKLALAEQYLDVDEWNQYVEDVRDTLAGIELNKSSLE